MRLPLLALLFLGAAATASAAVPTPEARDSRVYKRVGDRELKLYITRPADAPSAAPRPAIVFFHGGGWTGGAPTQFDEQSRYFASRGLVCIQVQYRLLEAKSAQPPDVCIHDARTAMRWVRTHAGELGIDPARIAAAGGSAGGHLAAHAGLVDGVDDPADDPKISAKPAALILFNPVLDNGPGGWGTARVGARFPELSPAHNVSRDDPPAVVFLGTKDNLIPVATLERFRAAMRQAGVRCDLHLYEGEGHGFFNHRGPGGGKAYALTVREADRFLASLGWVRGEPTLPAPAP